MSKFLVILEHIGAEFPLSGPGFFSGALSRSGYYYSKRINGPTISGGPFFVTSSR
jgi:hypothetical protein